MYIYKSNLLYYLNLALISQQEIDKSSNIEESINQAAIKDLISELKRGERSINLREDEQDLPSGELKKRYNNLDK